MALHKYRYQWVGLNMTQVNALIPPEQPATWVAITPQIVVDLSAESETKPDLDEVMASMGWSFLATDPP